MVFTQTLIYSITHMGKIIAFLNSKGGSGKTTIATNCAHCLHQLGHKVLIVDTDPQGTALEWSDRQTENSNLPAVVALNKSEALYNALPKVSPDFDFIIIDGVAKLEKISTSAIKVSDIILVPVQPSGADIWGASELVEFIKARQEVRDGMPKSAFIVSRQIVGTNLASDVMEALQSYEMPVLSARTSQRVAYTEALTAGTTVLDIEPHGKASEEIKALTAEILALTDSLQDYGT